MSTPKKCRKVDFFPQSTYFVPKEKGQCTLEEVTLKVEELEAIRLKDIEGLSQNQCAEHMEVSRQTFQNIIDSARKKIAVALTAGKAIRIAGGDYKASYCRFICSECGKLYDIRYEQDKKQCPSCGSIKVHCSEKQCQCKKMCCKKI